jgi:hypothetical protein
VTESPLLDPAGPAPAARSWLEAVLAFRDLTAAWPRTDPAVRLAIAQGWLFTKGEQSDEQASALAAAPSTSPQWREFAGDVLDALADKWSFFDYHGEWGVVDLPEPSSIQGCELVHFVMTEGVPPGPIEVKEGEPWATLPLLMRRLDEGWLVAGFSQGGPPTPGWPPTWPTGPKVNFDV